MEGLPPITPELKAARLARLTAVRDRAAVEVAEWLYRQKQKDVQAVPQMPICFDPMAQCDCPWPAFLAARDALAEAVQE